MTRELPAIACTLDAVQLERRTLEWSDIGPLALTREPIAGGVASTYPLEIAGDIEDLASREQQCCGSWLSASTTRTADVIRLELTTTNPDGLALIESMAGLGP